MSRIRANKFVNSGATGAPQLTFGAEVPVGYGITGAGGINITGVATATTFDGNATTATNAQGLTGTPNITINNLVGVAATFTGVLTYEDVTNIDSIGIITARAGVNVTGGNVGINSTIPRSKLHVANGNSNFNPGNPTGLGAGAVASLESSGDVALQFLSSTTTDNFIYFGDTDSATTGSIQYDHNTNALILNVNGGTERLRITSTGNLTSTGTISDSIGPLRRLGVNAQSGAYVFVVGDAGKIIRSAGSGAALTLNQNIFTAGDMISVFNVSGGANTVVQGTGVTLYNTADAATGTRTIAAKGMVTIVCTASNEFAISGSQLT